MSNFSIKVCRLEDIPDFLVECRKDLSKEVGIPLDSPYNRMNPGDDPTNIVGSYCLFLVMFDGDKPVSMTETFLYTQKYTSFDTCSLQNMLTHYSDPLVDLSKYCGIEDMVHLRSVTTVPEYRSKTVVFPGTLYATLKVLDFMGKKYVTAMSRLSLRDIYERFGFQILSAVDVTASMNITANDAYFIILSVEDWVRGKLCKYIENRMKFTFEMDKEKIGEIFSRKSLL